MFKFKSECLIFAIIFNVYHYVNFCVCFVFVFWYDLLVKIVVVNFFNFFWFFCWQKLIHTVLYILRVTHKTSHSNQCASGSVVEHLLAKEGAAGSSPVSRFFFCNKKGTLTGALFYCKIEPEFRLEGSISLLPPRSLLLTPSRGVHRTPATRLVLFLTFLGLFCVCTYIWKILKLKHLPKKLTLYIKIGY